MNAIETIDYSIFKEFSSNREVDQKHVRRLMCAINKKNLLHVNPIVVDESMRVIDGQHRLAAAKTLGVSIFYIQDNIQRSDISMLNSNQKNWNAMDYINFYTIEKKDAYVQLSSLMNHFPDMATSALISLSNSEGKRNNQMLKDGNLEVLNINHCREICALCTDLNKRFDADFVFDSRFPLALSIAMNDQNWNTETFIEKIKASPRSFVRCHTKEQYVEMIEEIFNRYLSKNQIRIR
jgi:hypothetical protein